MRPAHHERRPAVAALLRTAYLGCGLALLMPFAACGGGGGGSAAPPIAPSTGLVWGQGNWGDKQWVGAAPKARIDPNRSTTEPDRVTLAQPRKEIR